MKRNIRLPHLLSAVANVDVSVGTQTLSLDKNKAELLKQALAENDGSPNEPLLDEDSVDWSSQQVPQDEAERDTETYRRVVDKKVALALGGISEEAKSLIVKISSKFNQQSPGTKNNIIRDLGRIVGYLEGSVATASVSDVEDFLDELGSRIKLKKSNNKFEVVRFNDDKIKKAFETTLTQVVEDAGMSLRFNEKDCGYNIYDGKKEVTFVKVPKDENALNREGVIEYKLKNMFGNPSWGNVVVPDDMRKYVAEYIKNNFNKSDYSDLHYGFNFEKNVVLTLPYEGNDLTRFTKLKKLNDLVKLNAALAASDLSPAQEAYQAFFKAKLEDFGVSSPAELDEDEKTDFFNEIELEWKNEKSEASLSPFTFEQLASAVIADSSMVVNGEELEPHLEEASYAIVKNKVGFFFNRCGEHLATATLTKANREKALSRPLILVEAAFSLGDKVIVEKGKRKGSSRVTGEIINMFTENGQDFAEINTREAGVIIEPLSDLTK